MTIKEQGRQGQTLIKRLYPTGAGPKTFMGYPKFMNREPLRPIVSSMGVVTYGVAKELANILRPLIGYPAYHIRNTQHFGDYIKSIMFGEVHHIL